MIRYVFKNQTPAAVIASIIVVLVVLVCMRLSYWQYQRGIAKVALEAKLMTQAERGPLDAQALFAAWQKNQDLPGRDVALTGVFSGDYWLLDNQILAGKVGYDVLAVMIAEGINAPLLVNLGFISGGYDRRVLPEVALPNGQVPVAGKVKSQDFERFSLSGEKDLSKRVQSIDFETFNQSLETPLLPLMVYETSANTLGTPHYEFVVMPAKKHWGYSVQWLLIGAACLVIAWFALWRPIWRQAQQEQQQNKAKHYEA